MLALQKNQKKLTAISLFQHTQQHEELPLLPICAPCENSHIQMQS